MDLENSTLLQLCASLNAISQEIDKLVMEYNSTVEEIKKRIPSVKDDDNLAPKIMVKSKDKKV